MTCVGLADCDHALQLARRDVVQDHAGFVLVVCAAAAGEADRATRIECASTEASCHPSRAFATTTLLTWPRKWRLGPKGSS